MRIALWLTMSTLRPAFARTALKRLFYTVIGIYLLYVIPINVGLMGGFISGAASEGEGKSFNLKHDFAWSFIPGEIFLRGVEINGTDPNVFWQIKIDRMHFHARLLELVHKKLHITQLRADGTSFSATELSPEKRAEVRARLAEHKEEREAEEAALGKKGKKSSLRLRIDDILLAHFRSARMNEVGFTGEGSITGAFELHPGQFLEVIGGAWNIESGDIHSGTTEILKDLRGRTLVTIHPTELENAKGNEIFRTFDIDQKITSSIFDAEIFRSLIQGYRPMIFGRTEGNLSINLQVTGGFIRAGTSIQGRLDKLTLRLAGAELDGRGQLNWTVAPTAQGKSPVGSLRLELNPVQWMGQKNPGDHRMALLARTKEFRLTGETRELSLVAPFRDLALHLRVANAETGRIETVVQHLAGGKTTEHPMLSGAGARFGLDAKIRPTPGTFAGRFDIETPALAVTADGGKTILNSHVRGAVDVASSDYDAGRFTLERADLNLSDLHIDHAGKETYSAKDWSARMKVSNGKFQTKGDFAFDGRVALDLTNAGAPARLAAPDAGWLGVVLFLYPMNNLRVGSSVHLRSDDFNFPDIHATSSSGTIDGHLAAAEGRTALGFFFDISPANVCLTKAERDEKISFGIFKSRAKCLPNKDGAPPILAAPTPAPAVRADAHRPIQVAE